MEKRTSYEEDRRERLLGREENSKPKKNTENFTPSHEPAQMRIIAVPAGLVRSVICYLNTLVFIFLMLIILDKYRLQVQQVLAQN